MSPYTPTPHNLIKAAFYIRNRRGAGRLPTVGLGIASVAMFPRNDGGRELSGIF